MNREQIEKVQAALDFLCRRLEENGLYSPALQPVVSEAREVLRSQPQGEPVRFATATPATFATLEHKRRRTVATVATVTVAKSPEGQAVIDAARCIRHCEEAERKLKRICACEFSSGGVLKQLCEFHYKREVAVERNALERAAKVCDAQALEPECPERAKYCADAIRALMKEGGGK